MFVRVRAWLAIAAIAFGASTWLRALHGSMAHASAPVAVASDPCESGEHSHPAPAAPESHRSCPLCDLIHASSLANPEPAPVVLLSEAPRAFVVATVSATACAPAYQPNQPRAPPV